MSSKAEKTSHHSPQQPRLSIFFRNPLLLKIVAWLGSLSFIGSTGVVWADLKPISTSQTEAQALIKASASADTIATRASERDTYGPYLPLAQKQSPVQVTPASPGERLRQELPNREVPTAVAPASASISPTGTIVRPQHTDVMTADNYTVGVNESGSDRTVAEEFITIPVPAPLSATIPSQTREIVTISRSQIQPSYVTPQSPIDRSAPTTSIQSQPNLDRSANGYVLVPEVANLPPTKSTAPQVGRAGTTISRPTAIEPSSLKGTHSALTPKVIPLAGIKPTVLAPMKPPVMARSSTVAATSLPAADSIDLSVPTPRTQRIQVLPVAQLPKITGNRVVPTVPAIPSVRPAALSASQSHPVALNTGTGEPTSQLIYPLSSPAPTTSGFGWRTHPITGSRRFHSGLDIGAPMGAPVVAAGSGTIVSAGWYGGYGKAIVIQHNGVQQTLYGHLSEVFVQPGQRIEQGTVIGRVGSTGNSTGPHLHFETRVSTTDGWVAVDPSDDVKYALDNLRQSMPFAQRDLPPGYN
jgi:murein DD-endopeptidase MepM/ murein hydrolase activator NlpD